MSPISTKRTTVSHLKPLNTKIRSLQFALEIKILVRDMHIHAHLVELILCVCGGGGGGINLILGSPTDINKQQILAYSNHKDHILSQA
jgi:hypothetical protein